MLGATCSTLQLKLHLKTSVVHGRNDLLRTTARYNPEPKHLTLKTFGGTLVHIWKYLELKKIHDCTTTIWLSSAHHKPKLRFPQNDRNRNVCKIKQYKFSPRNLSFNSTVTFSSSVTPLDFPHSLNFNSRADKSNESYSVLFLISPQKMTSHIPFNELRLCPTWGKKYSA